MNPRQISVLQKHKEEFILQICRATGFPKTDLENLLRGAGLTYSDDQAGKAKLKEQVMALIAQVRQKENAEEMRKLFAKVHIEEKPCWLHDVEGIMCQGVQRQPKNGIGFPSCSIGGIRHYLVWNSNVENPAAYLADVTRIAEQKAQEQEAIIKEHRIRYSEPICTSEISPENFSSTLEEK